MHSQTRRSCLRAFGAASLVVALVSACSSSSKGLGTGDDGSEGDGGSTSSSGSSSSSTPSSSSGAGSSSGSSPSTGSSGSSSGATSGSSSGTKANTDAGTGPTVLDCGGSCALATHTCCKDALGSNNTCVTHGTTCPTLHGSFACEGAVDCPSGQVCCGYANEGTGSAGTECRSTCPTESMSASQGQAQVCKTDAECAKPSGNGMACIPQMCVGGSDLSLCGLTTAAPYSCTSSTTN